MRERELKCRDLSIGDWVQDSHGMRWQVCGVGEDYAYATFDGNEGDPWEFDDKDDRPYAIELTGTMLERNGWGENIGGYSMRYCFASDSLNNPKLPYYIEFYRGYLKIFKDYIEGDCAFADIVAPVTFVHELHQALRLAGLGYIADNFKL